MGNTVAPTAPGSITGADWPKVCPLCKHSEKLANPEPSLWRLIARRPTVPHTCAHVEVEQDALVDDVERCRCANKWHIMGSQEG